MGWTNYKDYHKLCCPSRRNCRVISKKKWAQTRRRLTTVQRVKKTLGARRSRCQTVRLTLHPRQMIVEPSVCSPGDSVSSRSVLYSRARLLSTGGSFKSE